MNFKLIFILFLAPAVLSSTFAMEEKELTIFQAAKYGNLARVKKLLEDGAGVNDADQYGAYPLHLAAHYGHSASVELLLNKGAHINAMSDGGTALHWASYAGHFEVVQLLLEYGADIDRKGYQAQIKGKTALEIAKHYNLAAIVGLIEAEPLRRQKQEKQEKEYARHMKAIAEQSKSTDLTLLLVMGRR